MISIDPKRHGKALLGRYAARSGALKTAMQDRAVITCFHSVVDNAAAISTHPKLFTEFCDLLVDHFQVISFNGLLNRLERGQDITNLAVITFDDGYADNAEVAAGILAERGLPATFFVASGFIGTDHQAWWDAARGVPSRWMTWDQVRFLRDSGFTIGAHTQTHVDLGKVPLAEARAEILGSVDDIARELGEAPTLFAYPFGGQAHMRDEVREILREAGLRCCPSSFGGLVRPDADPYRLRRTPITQWYISAYQFAYEIIHLDDDHIVDEAPVSDPSQLK